MKNAIKRILLLLPVISVLLVALAVPVFADAIDGGSIKPVTFEDAVYYVGGSLSDERNIDVTLGMPVTLEGGDTYEFSYFLEVDTASLSSVSFDTGLYGSPLAMRYITRYGTYAYILGRLECDGTYLEYLPISTGDASASHSKITLSSLQSLEILCTYDTLSRLGDLDYTYYIVELSPVDGFTSVWTEIMTWITSALNSVMGAFYVDGSLTLLGTLAVIGVSVGIGFLLLGLIQRFLHPRG